MPLNQNVNSCILLRKYFSLSCIFIRSDSI